MRVEVETPSYAGVRVDHPGIVMAIQNLYKQGRSLEDIVKVVGMPGEVVERHIRDYKRRQQEVQQT